MNCEGLLELLEETPLSRWTLAQRASARKHSRSCDNCATLLREQEALFQAFDEMTIAEPATTFALQPESEPHHRRSPYRSLARLVPGVALVFLCFGSVVQLFSDSGMSLHLYADSSRFESVINLVSSGTVLPVALTLVGLMYALSFGKSEPR